MLLFLCHHFGHALLCLRRYLPCCALFGWYSKKQKNTRIITIRYNPFDIYFNFVSFALNDGPTCEMYIDNAMARSHLICSKFFSINLAVIRQYLQENLLCIYKRNVFVAFILSRIQICFLFLIFSCCSLLCLLVI